MIYYAFHTDIRKWIVYGFDNKPIRRFDDKDEARKFAEFVRENLDLGIDGILSKKKKELARKWVIIHKTILYPGYYSRLDTNFENDVDAFVKSDAFKTLYEEYG